MRNLKHQIIELRGNGLTYKQISEKLNCGKSAISYHCGIGQKEKTKLRNTRNPNKLLSNKAWRFGLSLTELQFLAGNDPTCYLTGQKIDIYKANSYAIDHVLPLDKGGTDNIKNLGICTIQANQSKSSMTISEFISLCIDILITHGKIVTYKNAICEHSRINELKLICDINNKVKTLIRTKFWSFFCCPSGGKRRRDLALKSLPIKIEVFLNRFMFTDRCYISGRYIDIFDPKSYWLDHVIPQAKGGLNEFNNMMPTTPEANQIKSSMLLDELLIFCESVLINFGYCVYTKLNRANWV